MCSLAALVFLVYQIPTMFFGLQLVPLAQTTNSTPAQPRIHSNATQRESSLAEYTNPKENRWIAYPYWHILGNGRQVRLPESFSLRNRVRALLLAQPNESTLHLAKRARQLAPNSTDARFLEAYIHALLQNDPVATWLRDVHDTRTLFLRFLDAYRHGDLEQFVVLLGQLNLNTQDRFFLFVSLGNQLVRDGVFSDAQMLLRKALEIFEFNHAGFFGIRGTVKRDVYRFIVTCLAEIRFKSNDYHTSFGFLQWIDQNDFIAAQDPANCRWDELLERRCTVPDPLVVQIEHLPWYVGDTEQLDFHKALWAWSKNFKDGVAIMDVFLEKHPQSPWVKTVQDFQKWLQYALYP